jgi:hypothetical protein
MILVDTSIWEDYLRAGDAKLGRLLREGRVLTHPFVIGEIALGVFDQKPTVLMNLQRLPATSIALPNRLPASESGWSMRTSWPPSF